MPDMSSRPVTNFALAYNTDNTYMYSVQCIVKRTFSSGLLTVKFLYSQSYSRDVAIPLSFPAVGLPDWWSCCVGDRFRPFDELRIRYLLPCDFKIDDISQ